MQSFIPVLILVSVGNASKSPQVQGFLNAINQSRESHKGLYGDERIEAFQKDFFQISLDYPIVTDWVMQDGGSDAWEILLPEFQDKILERLYHAHDGEKLSSFAQYVQHCDQRRSKRLTSVLKDWAPFTFTEGETIRNSFFGYTEGLSDARAERYFKAGARLTILSFKEDSTYGQAQSLIEDPHGMMRDVDLSFGKDKLAFSWKKSDRLDDYHIYQYDLMKGEIEQLTYGLGRADYEPIYLPDNDLIFVSTRPEQSVPCWKSEISNLYRMDREGRYIRRLAIDQVHTVYPQLLKNGRISYTRWDYSDRAQTFPHPVFSMDPDGQGQRVFYGGNSWFPTSLLHMRPIPGSHKTMAIAAGHHTGQNGKLAIIDVLEGRDEGVGLHLIAPKREHGYDAALGRSSPVAKDRWGQEGDQFRYPYPLNEEEFLISYLPDYGFDPHWHYKLYKGYISSNNYGLYWMNADGERELLWRAKDLGVQRMVSLKQKALTELIPDTVDYTKSTGTYYIHDVYQGAGLEGIPRGEAKTLRVVEIDYRAAPVGEKLNGGPGGGSMNSTPVSIGNATWDVKRILGDADIQEDGSAMVEVPAMVSQYHQILNAKGQVIQTTRTWDTIRPGENKSCMGCHNKENANYYPFQKEDTIAWQRGAQQLKPFYGKTRGFSFVKEIQPILDRNCIACHDGSDTELMDLRGIATDGKTKNKRRWTHSYLNLTDAKLDQWNSYRVRNPEEGVVSWISQMSVPTELPPYFAGSAKSPLIEMLEEGHYEVELTDEDYHKLFAWIDLLVPFSGDYREGNAWSEEEMQFYDYYENKRKAQKYEEAQNIAAYLTGSGVHPVEVESTAPFTRAAYQSQITNLSLKPDADRRYDLSGQVDAVIEMFTFSTDATERVSLSVRHRDSGHVFQGIDIEPGETVEMRFRRPIRTGISILECSAENVTIEIKNAVGVLFEELPGDNTYRRHQYAN